MSQKHDRRAPHPSDTTWLVAQLVRVLAGAKHLWTVLLYSSAYLSVVTVVEVGIAMTVLSLLLSPAPVVVVGLITFAVYANDRITDVDDGAVDNPSRPHSCAAIRTCCTSRPRSRTGSASHLRCSADR